MAAQLTEWERSHIDSIHWLVENASHIEQHFKVKERGPDVEKDKSKDWMTFRYFALDLYSALDYTWYLLYCHFSNGGHPDLTRKGTLLSFPSKPGGVKCSDNEDQDQRRKFMDDKTKLLWGDKFGPASHFYKEIGGAILGIQPKVRVDNRGDIVEVVGPLPGSDEESFALLHFYRNCVAHKDLICFLPKKTWVEINQNTREVKLITSDHPPDRPGFYCREMEKGYWLQIPESLGRAELQIDSQRLLLDVLKQLLCFVRMIVGKLLHAALIIPPAEFILKSCIKDLTIEPNYKQTKLQDGRYEVTVRGGIDGKPYSASQSRSSVPCSVDACYVDILRQLQRSLPPESFSNPHLSWYASELVRSPEPQDIKQAQAVNALQMLNQYFQNSSKIAKKLSWGPVGPQAVPDMEQFFLAQLELTLSYSQGQDILKISSGEKKEKGKKMAMQAAAEAVVGELTRLGLIRIVS